MNELNCHLSLQLEHKQYALIHKQMHIIRNCHLSIRMVSIISSQDWLKWPRTSLMAASNNPLDTELALASSISKQDNTGELCRQKQAVADSRLDMTVPS